MVTLRPYRDEDLGALYEICLLTGNSGLDGSGMYSDRQLLGHLYSAPYGVLEPKQVFVAEDDQGVSGYIVGTHDSDAFADKQDQEWWPLLRQRYEGVDESALTPDDLRRLGDIRRPHRNPADLVARYPAHIHMNLLPHLRGQRVGSGLLQRWIEGARAAGVQGIHLGANLHNTGGRAFWTRSGFEPLRTEGTTVWFGMTL